MISLVNICNRKLTVLMELTALKIDNKLIIILSYLVRKYDKYDKSKTFFSDRIIGNIFDITLSP